MNLLTRNDVYAIDRKVLASGRALEDLINEVGLRLTEAFQRKFKKKDHVLVLCGPGHNGADGMALAHHLKKEGYKVAIFWPERQKVMAQTELQSLTAKVAKLEQKNFSLEKIDVVVDALFGVGLDRPMQAPYEDLISDLNNSAIKTVAIDIPSGVDSDTGEIHGSAINADYTFTVGAAKLGLHLLPGREMCGEIQVVEVKALKEASETMDFSARSLVVERSWINGLQPKRGSNKYTRGKVSVVLCETYPGAALLSGMAAQNAGAGYVQVFCPKNLLALCQVTHPQLVFRGYETKDDLLAQLCADQSQAYILGPGWDLQDFSLGEVLAKDAAVVLDGGILQPELLASLAGDHRAQVILTPHNGELARLADLNQATAKVKIVRKLAAELPVVLVAKGYDTIIARGQELRLTTWNSPQLATAGSGDILTGIIGAFVAQGLDAFCASQFAVEIHRRLGLRLNGSCTPLGLLEELAKVNFLDIK